MNGLGASRPCLHSTVQSSPRTSLSSSGNPWTSRRASSQDVEETNGIRKVLNLGHTAGHALESWAMAEGLDLCMARPSRGDSVSSWPSAPDAWPRHACRRRDVGASHHVGTRVALPGFVPARTLWGWARMDKKNDGEAVRMVLLSEDGARWSTSRSPWRNSVPPVEREGPGQPERPCVISSHGGEHR